MIVENRTSHISKDSWKISLNPRHWPSSLSSVTSFIHLQISLDTRKSSERCKTNARFIYGHWEKITPSYFFWCVHGASPDSGVSPMIYRSFSSTLPVTPLYPQFSAQESIKINILGDRCKCDWGIKLIYAFEVILYKILDFISLK